MTDIIPYRIDNAPYPFPTMPTPLTNDGFVFRKGDIIPHNGTLIDNIDMPTAFATGATGDIIGRLGTSTIWTVNATDINAAADGFMGVLSFWYDSVNDRLYVWGVDVGTAPDTLYTAYITLETGVVTNVGNVAFGTDPSGHTAISGCAVSRTAIDSGNFTLIFSDRTVVINESTGAEVSNVASANVSESALIGNYATLDGTIFVEQIVLANNGTSYIQVTKGGNTIRVPFQPPLFGDVTGNILILLSWGDKVKVGLNGTTADTKTLRTFLRTELDAWLVKVLAMGGLA